MDTHVVKNLKHCGCLATRRDHLQKICGGANASGLCGKADKVWTSTAVQY